MEGIESVSGLDFPVYHSFNLYMVGAEMVERLRHTIPLFDEALGKDRELGFFGIYDRTNRGKTLKAFEMLMAELGFRLIGNRGTRNWKEKTREGEEVEIFFKNGKREAAVEFMNVDPCAGRARKFNLKPIKVARECYIADDGIQPVIGYTGDVYPCWMAPYPDTRAIGNIHNTRLSTILGREPRYLELFRACLEEDHDRRTDVCKFCVDISKECLGYQFRE
jgi:radical SAM protein with 4Fe4S-binding SPASM domain